LSNNRNFICKVQGCEIFDKIKSSEFAFFRKHLWRHTYDELRKTAFEISLIPSENELVQKSWLVRNLAKLSLVNEVFYEM